MSRYLLITKSLGRFLVCAGLALFLTAFSSSQAVLAADSNDVSASRNGTVWYDPNATCSTGGGNVTPGTGPSTGAVFPNLDPTSMANAINTWIQQTNSKSELSGLGSTIVASAKVSNINPFLIVTIAKEESSLADPSAFNVSHGNNSFGREATPSQPNFQGARLWYRWSSVKASVDSTAPENQGAAGGGDMATYLRDAYGPQIAANNLVALMEAYAPPSENDTAQYIANLNTWIGQLAGLAGAPSDSPSAPPGSSGADSGGGCGGQSVQCAQGSTANASLSATRQSVVCIAQQQLAIWKGQPNYPHPQYSETGYLVYSEGRHEEWCADFASWVYDQARYPLNPDPRWNISYVPNIQAVGEKNNGFHWHPESTYTPKPGDLAIHGSAHVNIVVSVTGSTVLLIGGDQGSGPYPGGSIVSTETQSSFHGGGITGYVSPD